MLFDCPSDRFLFAVMNRVVAAHDALQIRKLTNHIGDQVGFAQLSRSLTVVGVFAKKSGEMSGKLDQSVRFIPQASQFMMERDAIEIGDTGFKCSSAVFIPEKACVRKAGPQHTFISLTDPGRLFAANVAYRDELWQQLPPFIDKVKIFLMVAHGTDQNFRGDLQKRRFKTPKQCVGFFHQAGHYLQQSSINYWDPAGSLSQALNLFLDCRPAGGIINDDVA